MNKDQKSILRKAPFALAIIGAGLWFLPYLTAFFLITGTIDYLRNTKRDAKSFGQYFMGNGIPTWLLSPVNLLIDLLSYRNPGIYRLEDFPADYRREIEEVLGVFKARKDEIIADIDRTFESGRRGMYVFTWYGKQNPHNIAEFKRDFRFIKTIAVSVFSGSEATRFHYGPLRLTLRVLYNLTPVKSENIYIECENRVHFWHDDPLYIFDDTLMHRSVNLHDARRYCVFMDIVRPSPFPALLAKLVTVVAAAVSRFNAIFYKSWKMLAPHPSKTA